jgi:hypothetical protein
MVQSQKLFDRIEAMNQKQSDADLYLNSLKEVDTIPLLKEHERRITEAKEGNQLRNYSNDVLHLL